MGYLAQESVKNAMDGFISKNETSGETYFELEKEINQMERELVAYLIKLSNAALSEHDRVIVDSLFNVVNNIERVGELCGKYCGACRTCYRREVKFLLRMH